MNFQKIQKVERYQTYLDIAFQKAKKQGDKTRSRFKDSKKLSRITKSRMAEGSKVDAIGGYFNDVFGYIVKGFPSFDQLPEFYQEVLRCMIEVGQMRKSLAAINWAKGRIALLHKETSSKINKSRVLEKMNETRRAFYGRVSSLLNQVKDDLLFLEDLRKLFREVPPVKLDMFSAAIVGFPNVGKSTLLARLTASKPEIDTYPFTTKGINIGYVEELHNKMQLLDTPGTLDRFEKMNKIEKLAYLTMKHAAHIIIYVYDLTEEYSMEQQHLLFEKVSEYKKEIVVYLSKTDILDSEKVENFIKQNSDKKIITEVEDLKSLLLQRFKSQKA